MCFSDVDKFEKKTSLNEKFFFVFLGFQNFILWFFLDVLQEKKFKDLFIKYFDMYHAVAVADLNVQFGERVEIILKQLKDEISLECLCELLSKLKGIVSTELYITEDKKFKERQEDFLRIQKGIKEAETAAKRSIEFKQFNIEQQVKKDILERIGTGENFEMLKHNVKRVVLQDCLFEPKDYDNIRKEIVEDVKTQIMTDLLNSDEITNIKKDIKRQLLDELQDQKKYVFFK